MPLSLSILSCCNLSCRYCEGWEGPDEGHETFLSLEGFRSILASGWEAGFRQLQICGGEPLLHPRLFELLECASELGFATAVSTNGTMIDRSAVERLRRLPGTGIRLGLDGASASVHDYYRGAGVYGHVVEALALLRDAGIRTGIAMTLFRENIEGIPDMFRFCVENRIPSLRFLPAVGVFRARGLHNEAALFERMIAAIATSIREQRERLRVYDAFVTNTPDACEILGARQCGMGTWMLSLDSHRPLPTPPDSAPDMDAIWPAPGGALDSAHHRAEAIFSSTSGGLRGSCGACEFANGCYGGGLIERLTRELSDGYARQLCVYEVLSRVPGELDEEACRGILSSWLLSLAMPSERLAVNRCCMRLLPFWQVAFGGAA